MAARAAALLTALALALPPALAEYAAGLDLSDPNRPLFESQKGGHFSANTMRQLFMDIDIALMSTTYTVCKIFGNTKSWGG